MTRGNYKRHAQPAGGMVMVPREIIKPLKEAAEKMRREAALWNDAKDHKLWDEIVDTLAAQMEER